MRGLGGARTRRGRAEAYLNWRASEKARRRTRADQGATSRSKIRRPIRWSLTASRLDVGGGVGGARGAAGAGAPASVGSVSGRPTVSESRSTIRARALVPTE